MVWVKARITTCAPTTTNIQIGCLNLKSMLGFSVLVGPPTGSLFQLFRVIPENPVGTEVFLEQADSGEYLRIWDLQKTKCVPVSPKSSDDLKALEGALKFINLRRARLGQNPLNPIQAGWAGPDILEEADRLGWGRS